MTISGGCLCGAVRFEAAGEPLVSLKCHCRDCQYLSGGEPADAVVMPSQAVTVVKGEARAYWTRADSGNRVYRSFCATCGTPLFAGNEAHPEAIAIKTGALDEPARFPPKGHIWTASAQPWHHIDPALPSFDRNPPF
ncbi:MAG TPA: GFA family protein [Stellaceae bacterium]